MKIKEILEIDEKKLGDLMTEEEFERMQDLNLNINTFLDALQDSARLSGQEEDEEHITMSAYLDYLEEMKNC